MADPYATGVLNKEHHDRLVADLRNFARDAGIQPRWIWTPLADTCGPEEVGYVRQFNRLRAEGVVQGLCFVGGGEEAPVGPRMAAIAGALVRNFVRARVLTVGTIIDQLDKGDAPECSCLLIPNFFLPKAEGGTLAAWRINALYDLLTKRGVSGQQTVIYAANLAALGKEYGSSFSALVRDSFKVVQL